MSMESNSNRRQFITANAKASLALALPAAVPVTSFGGESSSSPNDQIQLGVIGFGRRCKYVMAEIVKLQDVRCRVVADVQESRRGEAKKFVDTAYGDSGCQVVRDFREVLARKDIDAVFIATGDRWHATAAMMAAQAGKDIYCEKPCGLTIEYCQQIDETIRKTGRVFQAGTQRRTVNHYRKAVQIARDGRLGRLTKLVASVYTPVMIINGYLLSRLQIVTLSIGICGWGLRRGGPTTKTTLREIGVGSGISIRAPDCWIGELIRWTCARWLINQTIQCPSNTYPKPIALSVVMLTGYCSK